MGGIIKTFKSSCLRQSCRNPPRLFKENCDPLTQHNVWMKVRVEKNVRISEFCHPLAITQEVTRIHWAGESGIKSGAALLHCTAGHEGAVGDISCMSIFSACFGLQTTVQLPATTWSGQILPHFDERTISVA